MLVTKSWDTSPTTGRPGPFLVALLSGGRDAPTPNPGPQNCPKVSSWCSVHFSIFLLNNGGCVRVLEGYSVLIEPDELRWKSLVPKARAESGGSRLSHCSAPARSSVGGAAAEPGRRSWVCPSTRRSSAKRRGRGGEGESRGSASGSPVRDSKSAGVGHSAPVSGPVKTGVYDPR